jgi:hypothetical protein
VSLSCRFDDDCRLTQARDASPVPTDARPIKVQAERARRIASRHPRPYRARSASTQV